MLIKNQKGFIIGAAICVILAANIYYFNNFKIPGVARSVERNVRKEIDEKAMPKQAIAVVASEEGISRYTELTEKLVKEKVKLVEIPEKYVVKGAVTDVSKLGGKITREDLRFGEQIVFESIAENKKWYGEYQRLKEYQVSSIVANEVKTGNIIDVLVDYGNGDYDVVLSKIRVIKLVRPQEQPAVTGENDGGMTGTDNETGGDIDYGTGKGYTLILALDEKQYRDMELAKGLGKLETRLYIDEDQAPSKTTFDYAEKAGKLRIPGENSKFGVTTEG